MIMWNSRRQWFKSLGLLVLLGDMWHFFFRPFHSWRSEAMDDNRISSHHCCLSCALLTHFAPDSPVQSSMLCALTLCLKYFSFCLHTSVVKSRFGSTCAQTDMLVLWAVQLMWMQSSQMLLTSSCLLPSESTTHNHTLPQTRPGLPRVASLFGWQGK